MTPTVLARILNDAASHIEAFGWIQYTSNRGMNTCAGMAIEESAGSIREGRLARQALLDFINAKVGGMGRQYRSIPHWNDMMLRTKKEVIKTMRECAAALVATHTIKEVIRDSRQDTRLAPSYVPYMEHLLAQSAQRPAPQTTRRDTREVECDTCVS